MKTCTGFNGGSATVENVKIIREALVNKEPPFGIKASGGIKSYEATLRLIDAGAHRIGTSSAMEIMKDARTHHASKERG